MSDYPALPAAFLQYLGIRDQSRAADIDRTLAALTDRERRLVQEVAVMGFVRGSMANGSAEFPCDSAIITEVIDACLALPRLYPTVSGSDVL